MTDCWSCPHRNARKATYEWTASPSGNQIPLCKECCCGWLENIAADPSLMPSKLRVITLARGLV